LPWKKWGPYLSERQRGTVREDYSESGDAWDYFSHDHARSRAYRWGEDGLAGISDDQQLLCFAIAVWNGEDPILKERLVGLHNRGSQPAALHLLPTLWFRNLWSWGGSPARPALRQAAPGVVRVSHPELGERFLYAEGASELLFTENETNTERLVQVPNRTPYVKDGIHNYVVHGHREAVNPEHTGTKAAAYYRLNVKPGGSVTLRLRLSDAKPAASARSTGADGPFESAFDTVLAARRKEADEFYASVIPSCLGAD